jgi:hypothetical protein
MGLLDNTSPFWFEKAAYRWNDERKTRNAAEKQRREQEEAATPKCACGDRMNMHAGGSGACGEVRNLGTMAAYGHSQACGCKLFVREGGAPMGFVVMGTNR